MPSPIKVLTIAAATLFTLPLFGQELFGLENSPEHQVVSQSPLESQDPDVSRALRAGYLSPQSTLHSVVGFKDSKGRQWKLQVFQNTAQPEGPTFFVPHDSEDDAFATGAWAISKYGGHLLAWECLENRLCEGGVDPNRHFLGENPVYLESVMRFFTSKPFPVITLHNNHDSHYSLGGSGAIYADLKNPYTDGFGFYHSGDPDDLIIYADTRPMESSPSFAFYGEEFKREKLNSIFEFIREQNALGGHMSTHVIRNTPMEYFNIEAQHGHLKEQTSYLETLFKILGID